jgi:hypothetical protein
MTDKPPNIISLAMVRDHYEEANKWRGWLREKQHVTDLPFVADTKVKGTRRTDRCWWSLKPTGNHSIDSALGRTVAGVYLNFITTSGACPLQWLVNDMPEGRLSPLETSFFRAIEEAAAYGHMCNEGRPFRR